MEYLIQIIEIIKLPGKIDVLDNQILIEYNDIRLTYLVKKKEIEIICTDYLSYHILRLINNKMENKKDTWIKDFLVIQNELISEYFIILKDIFENNYYEYCTICGIKHDKPGLSYITTCNNIDCINKSYHYPILNKLIDFNKSDSTTLILLIKTLFSALNHPKVDKIFNPLPKIYSITDVKSLISLIPKNLLENKLDDLIKTISESYDDFYLWKKLNNNLIYALLINSISNNYYSMYSYRDLVNTDLKKKILIKDDPFDDVDVEYFNINYSTEIENKIKSQLDNKLKYYYLYHGSPFHCWYSIIKNGLKVMSKTEFMTTGAVYGDGIYLSDQMSMSYGYSKISPPFNYSMIGLFQIIENPETHKKTSGIFVVPNENILILRSLIKINKPPKNATFYQQLNDYFIRQRTIDKNISDKNLQTLKNKRLSAELKLIEKVSDKFKVVSCSDSQETPWEINLNIGDKNYKLELEFYNYPLSPPLFRILNFEKDVKGIINKDFKIILPILDPGTWSISNKIVEVLEIIWTFLNNSY